MVNNLDKKVDELELLPAGALRPLDDLVPEIPGVPDGLALSCASRALPSVILVEYPIAGSLSTIFLLATSGPTLPLKSL